MLWLGLYLLARTLHTRLMLFAGIGIVILFLANAYLLGREYFELAAMRFRPKAEPSVARSVCSPSCSDGSNCQISS